MTTHCSKLLKILIFVLSCLHETWTFANGAPSTACSKMKPFHGGATPQESESKYKLHTINRICFTPKVPLELEINGGSFKGFLVEAKDLNNLLGITQGYFTPLNRLSHTLDCFYKKASALTHVNGQNKTNIQFAWNAPDDPPALITFRLTIVESFFNYWTFVDTTIHRCHDYQLTIMSVVNQKTTTTNNVNQKPPVHVHFHSTLTTGTTVHASSNTLTQNPVSFGPENAGLTAQDSFAPTFTFTTASTSARTLASFIISTLSSTIESTLTSSLTSNWSPVSNSTTPLLTLAEKFRRMTMCVDPVDAKICRRVRPNECYYEYYNSKCCHRCNRFIARYGNDARCLYGDWVRHCFTDACEKNCTGGQCNDYLVRYKALCCFTCRNINSTKI